jgi:hypothetical protein
VVSRAFATLLAPYVPLVALTVLWYPALEFLLSGSDLSGPSSYVYLFLVPIIALAYRAPKLAAERRQLAIELSSDEISLERVTYSRSQLLEVELLYERASRNHASSSPSQSRTS